MIENNDKSEVRIARGDFADERKRDMPEFQEFLLTHKLAQEKHVLFLAVWVSKFLAFSNRKGHQDLGLTVMEFLKSLGGKALKSRAICYLTGCRRLLTQVLLFIVEREKLRTLLLLLLCNAVL